MKLKIIFNLTILSKFYLIYNRLNFSNLQNSFDLNGIKIRQTDTFGVTQFEALFHGFPGVFKWYIIVFWIIENFKFICCCFLKKSTIPFEI